MLVGRQKQPELCPGGCLQVLCRDDSQTEFLGSRVQCQRCVVCPCTAQGRGRKSSSSTSSSSPVCQMVLQHPLLYEAQCPGSGRCCRAAGFASDAQGLQQTHTLFPCMGKEFIEHLESLDSRNLFIPVWLARAPVSPKQTDGTGWRKPSI